MPCGPYADLLLEKVQSKGRSRSKTLTVQAHKALKTMRVSPKNAKTPPPTGDARPGTKWAPSPRARRTPPPKEDMMPKANPTRAGTTTHPLSHTYKCSPTNGAGQL